MKIKKVLNSIENFISDFKVLNPQKPFWLLILFVIFITISITKEVYSSNFNGQPKIEEAKIDLSTFIPSGHILVPLELSNIENIDSILSDFGIVDLYRTDPESLKSNRLLASNVKIIRAPLNPALFAALVKDSENNLISELTYPVFAVIKNKNQVGQISKSIKKVKLNQTEIIFGDQL